MPAVGGVDKFVPPNRPQTVELHQKAHLVAADRQTALGHSCSQSAAAVRLAAGCKGRFTVGAAKPCLRAASFAQ